VSVPDLAGDGHEIVVKLRRALGYRTAVNRIAVWPERYGNVTNRNGLHPPASQRHGRGAEAGGKAASAGGKATKVCSGDKHSSGGKHRGISPDIANCSNAIGCARFSNGADCQARENRQQLQRRLRNKLQKGQRPLGWM
jgi:hypothetical protein